MSKAKGHVQVGADTSDVSDDLKKLERSFKLSATNINAALELVGKGLDLIEGGVRKAIESGTEWVEFANVQKDAEARRAEALRKNGELTEGFTRRLDEQAAALQKLTTYGDESTIALQGQLAALGLSKDQIGEATEATLGLAEVSGKQLFDAAKDVANVYRGVLSEELRAFNVLGKDAAETVELMRSNMALAEARARTFSGRVTQLENAWGDLKEVLGFEITEADGPKRVIDELKTSVEELTTFIQSADGEIIIAGLSVAVLDLANVGIFAAQAMIALKVAASDLSEEEAAQLDALGLSLNRTQSRLQKAQSEILVGAADRLKARAQAGIGSGDRVKDMGGITDKPTGGPKKKPPTATPDDLPVGAFAKNAGTVDDRIRKMQIEAGDLSFDEQQKQIELADELAASKIRALEEYRKAFEGFEAVLDRNAERRMKIAEEAQFFGDTLDVLKERAATTVASLGQTMAGLATSVVGGFGQMLGGMVALMASAGDELGRRAGAMLGGFLKMVGQTMLQVATVMGILSLGALAPQAIALGAGGALLIVAGAALEAGNAPSSASSAGGGGGFSSPPSRSRSGSAGGAFGGGQRAGFFGEGFSGRGPMTPTVVQIGVMVGDDPARVQRALQDALGGR